MGIVIMQPRVHLALFYYYTLFLVKETRCLWMCCVQPPTRLHTCSTGFVPDFDSWNSLSSFYYFAPKLIDNFQCYRSFPHYCAGPIKNSSKQNVDLSNCYLWVLLQASWLLSKQTSLFLILPRPRIAAFLTKSIIDNFLSLHDFCLHRISLRIIFLLNL